MCRSMVDIQSPTAEIRRGKKKKKKDDDDDDDDDSKFALRPHHVWKYGRHPISNR